MVSGKKNNKSLKRQNAAQSPGKASTYFRLTPDIIKNGS